MNSQQFNFSTKSAVNYRCEFNAHRKKIEVWRVVTLTDYRSYILGPVRPPWYTRVGLLGLTWTNEQRRPSKRERALSCSNERSRTTPAAAATLCCLICLINRRKLSLKTDSTAGPHWSPSPRDEDRVSPSADAGASDYTLPVYVTLGWSRAETEAVLDSTRIYLSLRLEIDRRSRVFDRVHRKKSRRNVAQKKCCSFACPVDAHLDCVAAVWVIAKSFVQTSCRDETCKPQPCFSPTPADSVLSRRQPTHIV